MQDSGAGAQTAAQTGRQLQEQATAAPPAASEAAPAVTETVVGKFGVFETLTNELVEMARSLIQLLPNIVIAIVVLAIVGVLAKNLSALAGRAAERAGRRRSLADLARTLTKVIVWVFGILLVMTIVFPSMTLGSIIAALGVGTLAIGFAFQDIFENFLAGILLMVREKMRVGDYIICQGVEGEVTHISLRETYLRRPSNETTVVPNSFLFKNPMEILTDADIRRHEIIVGVSYDTDADMAQSLIQKTVEGCEKVLDDQPVDVFAREFGASSIDYTVRWWSGSKIADMHRSRDEVIRRIKRALDDAGVEIPFPYQTLTFKEPLSIRRDRNSGEEADAA